MTCKQVRAALVACWGTTDELATEVLEHLEVCEECRRQALLFRETRAMVQSLPRLRAPSGLTQAVLAGIEREAAGRSWAQRLFQTLIPSRQSSWARVAAVAAALALAVGGGVWYAQDDRPTRTAALGSDSPVATSAAHLAGSGELDQLMLEHQTLEMTQPLADDAGVSLVVYTAR
ncbi:MAG: anti-sigma factor family protein [Armatimonadota bacterium]